MATDGSEATSDESVNFKCSQCSKVNKVKEAVKYCVECQGYCCQSCVDTHQLFPTLQGHHLMDKSNLKSTVWASDLPVVPTDTCDEHSIKILDMYCGNHDVVGCTSCMSLEHRNCTDVQLVPDGIDILFKESTVKETHQKLLEMKSEMAEIRSFQEKCVEELKKSRRKAVNEIKEFRKEMEAILEKLEKESIQEVEKCFSQLQLALQDEMEKTDNELKIMRKAALHLMKSEGNRAQQFVSVKVSQKKIAKTEKTLLALRACVASKISFVPDSNLRSYLLQIKDLGSARHDSTSALRQKTSAYVIKTARELNVRKQDDSETCNILGCCSTDDCKLLLADYSNKRLKRVDIVKMSVVDLCDLSGDPNSVCQTKRKEAAVTLTNNSIQFISLDGLMKTTRQITLYHYCYGIAYKDDRLYITDAYTSLYIHDISGTLLQKVSTNVSGKNLLIDTRHVVFSDSEDKCLITSSKGVIVFDDHMKHRYLFSDSELSEAWGVCSDGRGNIFVSGYNSHNVIQVGADGKKVGVVVKSSDGLRNPMSMCFDRQRCTLIITLNKCNVVKVFDLK